MAVVAKGKSGAKVVQAPPGDDASSNRSSPDKVVELIHQGILRGLFVPGQKLIEAELTLRLGVSRGPVREALKRLSAEGTVELTRHRGAFIRMMTRQETDHLLAILEVLTAFIARLAASALSEDRGGRRTRDALESLTQFKDGEIEDVEFLDQRRHFYDALIAIGGNSQLQSVMPMMRIHLLRLQVQPYFSNTERRQRVEEYAAVTKALMAGDRRGSEREMKKHMERMVARIARLPDEAFAPEQPPEHTERSIRPVSQPSGLSQKSPFRV